MGEYDVNDDELDGDRDPLIGTTVGDYAIESLLGVGGMGRVYRALDRDGEPVALKLIREDLASDAVFRERFEREARVAQRITNAHVVPVLHTGEHDGVPYLIQRYIRGGSLEQMLDRELRLELEVALRICADVAEGLDALFAGGLVHRDVKPANVLLELDGSALITDFGLAKDGNAHKPHPHRTGSRLARLHGARADSRRSGRREHRRLRSRLRRLSLPVRSTPVCGLQRHACPVGPAAG